MTSTKVTPASLLEAALWAADLGAAVIENGMAVRVVNPDNGAATTVWLPDFETGEGYIWGPTFSYTAAAGVGAEQVAQRIKATASKW